MPIREKKHRLQQDCYKGHISVSFTLCINNRVNLFTDAGIVNIFTGILEDLAGKFQCTIPVYCFMPDHLHVIIIGNQDDADILKFITHYKQKTGFWLSKNCPGTKWQKDFFDRIIRKDANLSTLILYILDNPVRKGLVAEWQDYPFKGAIGWDLQDILNGII